MKKHPKSKSSSSSSSAEPDIAGFMVKIQEQLSALERKMDSWIGQIAARSFTGEGRPQIVPPPAVIPQQKKEVTPVHAPAQGHAHERRERVLYKAICADCHKDCEIPFKPSGERPVYCKPCFSKRKTGGVPKGPASSSSQPVVREQRQIKVTPNGAGKVTVSEVVTSPARGTSQKRKPHKPAPKSKR